MAERRPDLAREHRLHDRFRGPPRTSPVRFQVSRPADRTSRGWARGVPLAECRFPGPATRGRSGGESERSTPNGRAKTFGGGGGGGGGAHTNSELPQAGFPESGEVYTRARIPARGVCVRLCAPHTERTCADGPYRDSTQRRASNSPTSTVHPFMFTHAQTSVSGLNVTAT